MVTRVVQELEGIELPQPGIWESDPAHTNVEFVVRHMLTKLRGRFTDFSITANIADEPEASSVEARIDAASIETHVEDRDNHLRSPDFLDVGRYPELTFRSTAIKLRGGNRLDIIGDLTIRDVTREVVFETEYLGAVIDSHFGHRASFAATMEIEREDFGMTWNMVLESGGFLVGKTVRIELQVELVRKDVSAE